MSKQEMSKKDLLAAAKALEVAGRNKMSKDELIVAIEKIEAEQLAAKEAEAKALAEKEVSKPAAKKVVKKASKAAPLTDEGLVALLEEAAKEIGTVASAPEPGSRFSTAGGTEHVVLGSFMEADHLVLRTVSTANGRVYEAKAAVLVKRIAKVAVKAAE